MSFCAQAMVAANSAVAAPTIAITSCASGATLRIGLVRAIR